MGSGASKSTRKLPTTTPRATRPAPPPPPTWAGARTPPPDSEPPFDGARSKDGRSSSIPVGSRPAPSRFSGEKDDALRADALDSQFASNLSALGQVSIHDAGKFMRTPSPAQRTLNARQAQQETPVPSNALTAVTLSAVLDQLKTLPAGADRTALYRRFGVDGAEIDRIRKFINSPSIGDETNKVVEGETITELKAIWVDTDKPTTPPARRIPG